MLPASSNSQGNFLDIFSKSSRALSESFLERGSTAALTGASAGWRRITTLVSPSPTSSSSYPGIVRDINNSIMLYQQGYIDAESLTKPYRRNSRTDGDPMMIDDFNHEVNEGLMQSLLDIMDQYSDEKISSFSLI